MTPVELAAMVDRLAPQITGGPWAASDPHGDGSYYEILGRNPDRHTYPILCDVDDPNDAEAIALVPDLMAENQRIRRELETLRADVKYMKPLPERITKILNGGNQ